ncbi:phosducin family protein [Dothidotthia symphoricarpi CBS 119687]|uniref:Phosducin family protein n=1 Tax=Dothidotthia symphoricarpi CBS 119687 TaxID=1392245 RepID=A0A6A6ALY5_9PLEO|nr:phosducin family protein [Dothidotthia symphoricarpi CBS 119687]KAF2131897.1 phosducin family protein [Dothidotthia symphoricarpi CBS 119687]
MPVNVPVDDPNADTEWNDILRKHGVIPEKPPSPTAKLQEAVEEALKVAHENRLEGKDLDELDALEDDEDEDFLEVYRQKRLAELSTITNASVYNQVYHLQKPDYSRDVTETSQNAFVLVLLTSSQGTNTESRILIEIWRELAQRFGDVKFCQMRAELCIEGYPDRNTPTILVYSKGDIKKQIVTLRELGGVRTKVEDLERLLVDVGALKGGDQRLKKEEKDEGASGKKIRQGTTMGDDDDSDWD